MFGLAVAIVVLVLGWLLHTQPLAMQTGVATILVALVSAVTLAFLFAVGFWAGAMVRRRRA
jgi:uncharacterized membrane protein